MWRYWIILPLLGMLGACASRSGTLSDADRSVLAASLARMDSLYDPAEHMITKKLNGWNYHTDADSGTYHEVRASLSYAVKLLDYGGRENRQRAFDIIARVIRLQDTATGSRTRGVWPYYLEEPLATKKSPPDFNWADFNGVSLLDVWLEHGKQIPDSIKTAIRGSLILAARSIQKRDVGPGYTNIAIMGTYVTYMTSTLFGLDSMQAYAQARLKHFYDYTLEKGGFTEYNSPTYTLVALDELNRMQRHITEPAAAGMIDSLYAIGWTMVARHYHQPSGQWAGPHSRAYSPLTGQSFYSLLQDASEGAIDLGAERRSNDVKIRHHIPPYLLPYFLSPQYPRTETDVFVVDSPRVVGTAYLAPNYVLASASRSSLWNQRHPLTAYWGAREAPSYLQVRFLHDFYDFSSASIYTMQRENEVLAAVNFVTNGGDKHISIDRLREGRFSAEDLRLRFEFGPELNIEELQLPARPEEPFSFSVAGMPFYLRLCTAAFGSLPLRWERGRDDERCWVDLVVYNGERRAFDLSAIEQALIGFALAMGDTARASQAAAPRISSANGSTQLVWDGLRVEARNRPEKQPAHL